MFRVKITAVLSLLIVTLMVIVYIQLPMMLEGEVVESASNTMHIAAASVERAETLNDASAIAKAKEIAAFSKLKTALTDDYSGNYEYERHLKVYDKGLLRWQVVHDNRAKLNKDKRDAELPLEEQRPFQPELVFVTDENGVGVAALGKGKYSWYNENVAASFPSLLSVADGRSIAETWLWRWDKGGKLAMYNVGIAPIMQGEELLGIVVVGHLINDGKAEQDSAVLGGQDVAYFYGDQVYASTLSPTAEETLGASLFGDDSPLGSSLEPGIVQIDVGGEPMLALVRYSDLNDKAQVKSGAVLLTNLKHELVAVEKIRTAIPIFGLILLVAMLATVLIAFSSFVKPFEEIDQGIQEVLAGNKDYVFRVSDNYAFQTEMANSLNLMSAYLQGKPMPDEDDDDDAWKDFLVSEVTQTSLMRAIQGDKPPEKPRSEEDVRQAYQRRVYDEYITAKKHLGEDISEIDFEGFIDRMEKNVAKLKVRHNARDIRFSVVVRDGKVVLKPQPVM